MAFELMPRDATPASPEGSVFATLAFYCMSGSGTLACEEAALAFSTINFRAFCRNLWIEW